MAPIFITLAYAMFSQKRAHHNLFAHPPILPRFLSKVKTYLKEHPHSASKINYTAAQSFTLLDVMHYHTLLCTLRNIDTSNVSPPPFLSLIQCKVHCPGALFHEITVILSSINAHACMILFITSTTQSYIAKSYHVVNIPALCIRH